MARWQVPVVLAAVLVGTLIGLAVSPGAWPQRLVLPALVGLLTLVFAGIGRGNLAAQVRPHRRTAATSLVLNFVWAPTAAGLLGWVFLTGSPELRIGLVMLLVTPCTDWYLVFTAAARGNVPLAAALLPVNLVLQLALLPFFVVVLTGAAADVPVGELVTSVLLVLGIPAAGAVVVRTGARRTGAHDQLDRLLDRLDPVGLALLAIAVAAIFAANAELLTDDPGTLLRFVPPLAVFFVATYVLATTSAKLLGIAAPGRATLTMTAMARNSPIALAVAIAAFPDQPLVAVALVIGPLVELPVLAVSARVLRGTSMAR